jgi:hypothetical protein
MKTFSTVLTEDRTVEDGRARLLHKHAQQTVGEAASRNWRASAGVSGRNRRG